MKQEVIGNYRINIFQDDSPSCPCTDWDMLGVHLFNYDDSDRLSSACNGDEVSATSLEDALRELVCKYVPQKKIIDYINEYCNDYRIRYDRSDHMWYLEHYGKYTWSDEVWHEANSFSPHELKFCDYSDEFCDILDSDDLIWLLHNCQRKIAFHEWQSRGYSQGDCADGISFCTRERFAKRYGKPGKDWRERAVKSMESEVDCIGKWLWGDVIGYVLEKKVYTFLQPEDCEEWEEIDSCWDYYCGPDELIENVVNEHDIRPKEAA